MEVWDCFGLVFPATLPGHFSHGQEPEPAYLC